MRKRVAKWLRENGSKPSDGGEEGDYFDQQTIDRAVATRRAGSRLIYCAKRESTDLRQRWTGLARDKATGQVVEWHDELRKVQDAYEFVFEQMPVTAPRALGSERFAAIDTGASKNPSALCIVERIVHEVNGERRYQFRPLVLKEWRRKPGGLPLDLRNVVLPEMARLMTSYGCVMRWWSDAWSGHDIENVGALFGIQTVYISTSTVSRDMYEPIDAALAIDPCPVVLNGCDGIDLAVAQLRQVRRANDGKVIVPKIGVDHGELGQVLVRALAHAGIGTMPPAKHANVPTFFHDKYSDFR